MSLTPRQIVAELDPLHRRPERGQKAVAVAIRNRWRRQQLAPEMRMDVTPKNIIMIGPTGVGKTRSPAGSRSSSAPPSAKSKRPNTRKSGMSAATSKA